MQTETIAPTATPAEPTIDNTVDIHANGAPQDWIPNLDLEAVL